jgi:hypothetical protein
MASPCTRAGHDNFSQDNLFGHWRDFTSQSEDPAIDDHPV